MMVWVVWQRMGADGIGAVNEVLCDSAMQLRAQLERAAGVAAVHTPESDILVWPSAAASDADISLLRRRLDSSGCGWITAAKLAGVSCLRVTLMN
jgi:glutamate/tyrosine decarboxylase-like PLP-dependent enzyme